MKFIVVVERSILVDAPNERDARVAITTYLDTGIQSNHILDRWFRKPLIKKVTELAKSA
jgi:hypothetical protein